MPNVPGAFPVAAARAARAPAAHAAPQPWEINGIPSLYKDLMDPVDPPSAAQVVGALKEAKEAINEASQAAKRDYAEVQKQLPWLVRRLGRKLARVVLPCVVAGIVIFAALSLPIMALLLGSVAGVATWFGLADRDPNPQRSMPHQELPRASRPRLAADTLELQMKVYAGAYQRLSTMLTEPCMRDHVEANLAFTLLVDDIKTHLAANKGITKPLEDERSQAAGFSTLVGSAAPWLYSVAGVGLLNSINALVDLPFPFGGISRYIAASVTWPVLQFVTVVYGTQIATRWHASLDSRKQVVADRLHIRRGEREALQAVLKIYTQARHKMDERLPWVAQVKFRVLDAFGCAR